MTPTAIISLVKDVVILGAVAFLIYVFITYGKDVVRIGDLKAVEKQIAANSQTQAQWYKDQANADAKRDSDLEAISTRIGQQRDPIIVRVPATPTNTVPPVSTPTGSGSSNPGPVDNGSGVDIRSQINAFELKYEKSLADCRNVLAKWPTQPGD